MSFIKKIKNFFKKLFNIGVKPAEEVIEPCLEEAETLEELEEKLQEVESKQFKTDNVIFEKLNYLEQYIKTFSFTFPKEYSDYLNIITAERQDYQEELERYNNGISGNITFSIDPEREAQRLVKVSNLEIEIRNFVEFVVNFSIYKGKFSKLCSKLNQFYNALLDTKKDISIICLQLDKAIQSMHTLVNKVKSLAFFESDSRKKEEILHYIIYGEYIFFKSSLRCGLVENFDDYKTNSSKFHSLFLSHEYDNLIFKFFIEDLEQYQIYINENLTQYKTYKHTIKSCQDLQNQLNDYQAVFHDFNFFKELILFENTVDNISDNFGIGFIIPLPKILDATFPSERTSIKDTAISVLNMINCNKAIILTKVLHNFNTDISWREFYFLCKIFELSREVVTVAQSTIFGSVHTKFTQLDSKYQEYSDSFIQAEKEKLLNYHGSKSKKYIFLLSVPEIYLGTVTSELKLLKLDFLISEEKVYLNHSYFKGFKNLETNFGNYKTLEELI